MFVPGPACCCTLFCGFWEYFCYLCNEAANSTFVIYLFLRQLKGAVLLHIFCNARSISSRLSFKMLSFTSTSRNNCLEVGYFPKLISRERDVERMQQSLGVPQLTTFIFVSVPYLICLLVFLCVSYGGRNTVSEDLMSGLSIITQFHYFTEKLPLYMSKFTVLFPSDHLLESSFLR